MDDSKSVTQEMQYLPAQLVNTSWVMHSISQGRLLPVYAYAVDTHSVFSPQTTRLAHLARPARDLAELIKAAMDPREFKPDLEALHRRVCGSCITATGLTYFEHPHHTAQRWASMNDNNAGKIHKATVKIKTELDEELADSILSLLSVPAVLELKEKMKNNDAIQLDDSVPIGEGNMEDDVEDEDDMRSLFGTSVDTNTHLDPGFNVNGLEGSESTNKELRRGRYEESEISAVVQFLVDHRLANTTLSNWRQFQKEVSSR